jgi:plasmid stabilization system protein ParE
MKVAIDMRKDILNAVKRLCYFPQMAQVELLLNDKSFIYRSLIVRDIFKIIYRVDEKKVYIIAIWDCRQNPETLEKRIK